MATANKIVKPKRVKLVTPVFRISFPNLFVARRSDEDDPNSKPKFGCAAVWTPAKFTTREKELWRALLGELNTVSVRDFRKPWKELPDNIRRGLRDGAAKADLEGYGDGTRFANITSKQRPGVIDKDRNPIGPDHGNEEEIYPGCYCRATVQVFSFGLKPGSKGKGVGIGLGNIQKIKDGPRLDNRVAAEDDFDEDVDSAYLDDADSDLGDESGDDDFES